MDVDLVANLPPEKIQPFVSRLNAEEYYVSQVAIEDAVKRFSCFNVIHLDSSFKVEAPR